MLFRSLPPGKPARATRLRTSAESIHFVDRVQGDCVQNVEREVGDFVVLRADGLFAYQLAVVVDDADQGVTDVTTQVVDGKPADNIIAVLQGKAPPDAINQPVRVAA